jgi:DNA-binding NtrC family response regulator
MEQWVEHEAHTPLGGARVLLVEDDLLILMELECVLSEAGAEIVGGCQTVKAALDLTGSDGLGAAVLDMQLGRDTIMPVARDLTRRGIPFVFYTGQADIGPIRAEWPQCRVIPKPAPAQMIVAALVDALARQKTHRASYRPSP